MEASGSGGRSITEWTQRGRSPTFARPRNPGAHVKKAKSLPHRNRRKSARYRARIKAKNKRRRLRKSSGERDSYR
jgi:hypothetical protein